MRKINGRNIREYKIKNSEKKLEQRKTTYLMVIIAAMPILAIFVSLVLGRYSISIQEFLNAILSKVLGIDITSHSSEVLRNIGSIIEVPIFYEHLSGLKIY